jgi:deoxyribonuclease-4
MLIGGHVSPAGGLVAAWHRGVERDCESIQIFNQSPRAWRHRNYDPEDVAELRRLLDEGPVRSIVIHAVYLINPASKDDVIRQKSLDALAHALRVGDAIGADGVVVHPGSTVGEPLDEAIERVGEAIRHVLAESESCPLLLENTAGAGGTIGRSFEELARLVELGGGHERIGLCLDSCHLLASGFDVRTADGLTEVIDRCVEVVGLERLRCLHVNDSQTGLGSNRDRHAPLGTGELGREGCAAFYSEPRFEGLPVIFEGPGFGGKGADAEDIRVARELRAEGLEARKPRRKKRAASRRKPAARRSPRQKQQ